MYSAGGKDSSIRISISAEVIIYNGPILLCGVQIFHLTDFSLYKFVNNTCNNVTISNLSQCDFKCLPVGPSGLPLNSSTTFELVGYGYHRLVMLAELSVSINSSITGQLFHYNTSFLNSVFCDLNTNCTLNLHSYRQFANVTAYSAGSASVCNLAFADEYTTVVFTLVQFIVLHPTSLVLIILNVGVLVAIIEVLVLVIFIILLYKHRMKSKCNMHIQY